MSVQHSPRWIKREAYAKAVSEVVEWDEFGQGYGPDAECIVCICGEPYPMRQEHHCPACPDAWPEDFDPDEEAI